MKGDVTSLVNQISALGMLGAAARPPFRVTIQGPKDKKSGHYTAVLELVERTSPQGLPLTIETHALIPGHGATLDGAIREMYMQLEGAAEYLQDLIKAAEKREAQRDWQWIKAQQKARYYQDGETEHE